MEKRGLAVCISNAAVFLQYGETKILIDGLYKDLGRNFSELPEKVWESMRRGEGELSNIDYLLFTHSHYDHFYVPYLQEYLEHNEVKGLCLPPGERWQGKGHSLSFDEEGKIPLPEGITLRFLDVRHLDKQFYDVVNRCFWVEIGKKHLLFLGDGDYQEEAFEKIRDLPVDTVFVTPIFYNNAKGRKILREILGVKKIVVYHLPFPEEDTLHYERMTRRDIEKYGEKDENVVLWNRTGQSILF